MIEVSGLCKSYKVKNYKNKSVFQSLFSSEYNLVEAVKDLNFQIDKGDIVGYIGLNGAGKSTTIKLLTGILKPDKGEVSIDGKDPYKHRKIVAKNIGICFGQKSQLLWDLPIIDTFLLHKKIYDIDNDTYEKNMSCYKEKLGLEKYINKPTRQLSLGQRAKANIALSLLHNPKIIFLDEPTIGLDVISKGEIFDLILDLNYKEKITVFLTTHDLADVEKVCNKIILIDEGKIEKFSDKKKFMEELSSEFVIEVEFSDEFKLDLPECFILKSKDKNKCIFFVDAKVQNKLEAVRLLVNKYDILDISVRDLTIEEGLKKDYE